MKRFLDFQFRKEAKLWPLFLNQSFRAVAISLLALFSSIYIYKTLLALTNQKNLALTGVFVFFLFLHIFKLFAFLIAEELSLKLGLKRAVFLGLTCLGLAFLALFFSLKWPWGLFLASIFWGSSVAFYWFGRHGLIIKTGREGDFGKELGIADALVMVFLIGVPFLGGTLINFAGYQALFLASLIFVLFSVLSLKSVKEKKTHSDTNLSEILILFKAHKKSFLAYLGDNAGYTIYTVVIPLYIFLILGEELSLGEFFSFSMLLVALVNLIIGRWVDIKGKRKMIGFGAVVSFLVWLGRMLTRSIGVLLVFDVLDRMTTSMTGIPLSVLTYEKALDGGSTGRALLFREVAFSLGSILACFLLLVLVWAGIELKFTFLLAGFFSLLPILLVKKT